jgi:hypothetical protein
MGVFLSFEVTVDLNGRPVVVRVTDHYIQDGDMDDEGNLLTDELVFNYRVFAVEEDAEITQLSTEDQLTIRKAILEDLHSICED